MNYKKKLESLGFKRSSCFIGKRDEQGIPNTLTEIFTNDEEGLEVVCNSVRFIFGTTARLDTQYRNSWALVEDTDPIAATQSLDTLIIALERTIGERTSNASKLESTH